ncbi:MAG: type II toxin-antitoxin system death-on-curing family toxin [Patescibacteria group bacterium]
MKKVKIQDIKHACILAREFLSWDEKIPPFDTANKDLLESSLETPFQSFSNKNLYDSLPKKGAALFYFLIKNHPFQNGNKRIAVTSVFIFFYKNGKWLNISSDLLYYIARFVAESKATTKDDVLELLTNIFKDNLFNEEEID